MCVSASVSDMTTTRRKFKAAVELDLSATFNSEEKTEINLGFKRLKIDPTTRTTLPPSAVTDDLKWTSLQD